jgi:hypothetical protein
MDDADPTVPAHLRDALGAAAELDVQDATDRTWPSDSEGQSARNYEIMRAIQAWQAWKAGTCDRGQLARLARVAVGEQDPGRWPRTLKEAKALIPRAQATLELIQLRDSLGGTPTQAELDAPL